MKQFQVEKIENKENRENNENKEDKEYKSNCPKYFSVFIIKKLVIKCL